MRALFRFLHRLLCPFKDIHKLPPPRWAEKAWRQELRDKRKKAQGTVMRHFGEKP